MAYKRRYWITPQVWFSIGFVDETRNREEVQRLTEWCSSNNLVLNTSKTKEVIADTGMLEFQAEQVANKFLGIDITADLTLALNAFHLVKKVQQRLFFFLRKDKRAGIHSQVNIHKLNAAQKWEVQPFSDSNYITQGRLWNLKVKLWKSMQMLSKNQKVPPWDWLHWGEVAPSRMQVWRTSSLQFFLNQFSQQKSHSHYSSCSSQNLFFITQTYVMKNMAHGWWVRTAIIQVPFYALTDVMAVMSNSG